jgi:hypothetical protein
MERRPLSPLARDRFGPLDVARCSGPYLATVGALIMALLLFLPPASWAQRGIMLDGAISAALQGSCGALQGAQGVGGGKVLRPRGR